MLGGNGLDQLLTVVAGLLVLAVVFLGLRRSPKVAVFAWVFVVCFVPVWIGVQAVAFFPAFTVVSLLAATSLVPALARVQWSLVDLAFVAVGVIAVVEMLLQLTTRSATFDLVATWASAFVLGRVVTAVLDVRWIYGVFAVAATVAAAFALGEFATSINPWVSYVTADNALYSLWSGLQPRGGVLRAEGAFGHSIALGTTLGVAVAFVLAARFRPWLTTVMVAVLAGGAVVTFSRTGMVTAALSLVLVCLFLRGTLSRGYRVLLLACAAAGAGVLFTVVSDVFATSGTEAAGSAQYRSELLQLVNYIQPFGLASNFSVSTTSVVTIGEFGSIDNALLLFALIFGAVPAVLVVVLLGIAGLYVLFRRATPATIVVVAQIPALVTVALITQYAAVFWFTVGLAVSTQVMAGAERRWSTARRHVVSVDAPPRRSVATGPPVTAVSR